MKRLCVVLALGGCVTSSAVGPYVKTVARNGAWLAVQKCMIVLDGDNLTDADCTIENVPLGSLVPGPPVPVPTAR